MKPVASPAQDSLALTGDVLALHAWRMPDMVLYQHAYEEWWLAPLEDTVPLVKINRAGLNLLNAMNGKVTVGALLEKFGHRVCGPNRSEEHTSELQSQSNLVCRLLLEKKKITKAHVYAHPLVIYYS